MARTQRNCFPQEAPQSCLSKGFLERYSKAGRQQLRWTLDSNDHVIFAAHPKLTGKVDTRLIRERHARLKHRFAATNQIRMFVTVEPDPVSQPMRKEFVIGAISARSNDGARSIIDGTGQPPSTRRIERGILGLADQLVRALYLITRFAKHAGARDVRLIVIHGAPAID